jgi:hypothetical protein
MGSRKKNREKKHRPYEQIKMKLLHFADPFGDTPPEVRRAAIHGAGANARATFNARYPNAGYPKMAAWFETCDPCIFFRFAPTTFSVHQRESTEGRSMENWTSPLTILSCFKRSRYPVSPLSLDKLAASFETGCGNCACANKCHRLASYARLPGRSPANRDEVPLPAN